MSRKEVMGLYFYHVRDDRDLPDDNEGVEFLDDKMAWAQAVRACGEFLQEREGTMRVGQGMNLEVTDETGRHCWTIKLITEGVPV